MKLTWALSLGALAGCSAPQPTEITPTQSAAPYACLLPSEQRMLVAELFFGRSFNGHEPLTDGEWREFAARIITPNFPDGFTVFDGDGQWRNPQTGHIAANRTKILLVAAKQESDLSGRLGAVIAAYKAQFHQQSVGVITRDSCAAF